MVHLIKYLNHFALKMIWALQYARFIESVHTGVGSENVTLAYKVHLLEWLRHARPPRWAARYLEVRVLTAAG